MAERRIRLHLANSRPQTPTNFNMIERIIWKRSQIRDEESSLNNFQEYSENEEQHIEEDESLTDNFQQEDPTDGSTDLEHDPEEVTAYFVLMFNINVFFHCTIILINFSDCYRYM